MGLTIKYYGVFRKTISSLMLVCFLSGQILPPSFAQNGPVLNLPIPGAMVGVSPSYVPLAIKGIKVFPDNPFRFDFMLDTGNSHLSPERLNEETKILIKYFLTALTIPDTDQWVNLSPYEKERIVPNQFGNTEMGRDLLAQDYLLKQLTASLVYPEHELGKNFWERVYKKAYEKYGDVDIPVSTFNKVWIMPEHAKVYEYGSSAVITESHLKVMLEEDYLAFMKNNRPEAEQPLIVESNGDNSLGSVIVREIVLPEIEKEINQGKNFAKLRQIYRSMIMAAWYKRKIKQGILSKLYIGANKVAGVDVEDKQIKQKIYDQYLEAFKKGVYNYIREDVDVKTQEVIPRKYFSGGVVAGIEVDKTTEFLPATLEQITSAAGDVVGESLTASIVASPVDGTGTAVAGADALLTPPSQTATDQSAKVLELSNMLNSSWDVQNRPLYEQTRRTLREMGLVAITELEKVVENSDRETLREQVIWTLGSLGPEAVPALVKLLENSRLRSSYKDAMNAINTILANNAQEGAAAVPALIRIIEDPTLQSLHGLGIETLANIGSPAASARSVLIEIVNNPKKKQLHTIAMQALVGMETPAVIKGSIHRSQLTDEGPEILSTLNEADFQTMLDSEGIRVVRVATETSRLSNLVPWEETRTSLDQVDRELGIRQSIQKVIKQRSDPQQPIVILEWGSGRGFAADGLAGELDKAGVKAKVIGFSDQYYPEWKKLKAPGLSFIVDTPEGLIRILRENNINVNFVYSRKGIAHYIGQYDELEVMRHLLDLKQFLKPEAEFRADYFVAEHQSTPFLAAGFELVSNNIFKADPRFGPNNVYDSGALKDLSVFDPARPVPEPTDAVLTKWNAQALLAPVEIAKVLEQDIEIKLIEVDSQTMPSGITAYHFMGSDGRLVVVIPSSIQKKKYLVDEILFHEAREAYWTKRLMTQRTTQGQTLSPEEVIKIKRDSHILAWADQIVEFGQNGLTPLQQMMMPALSAEDREALLAEADRSYQDKLVKQNNPDRYEEYLKNKQKFQDAIKELSAPQSSAVPAVSTQQSKPSDRSVVTTREEILSYYKKPDYAEEPIDITNFFGAVPLAEGRAKSSFPLPNGQNWIARPRLLLGRNLVKLEMVIFKDGDQVQKIKFIGYEKKQDRLERRESDWDWNGESLTVPQDLTEEKIKEAYSSNNAQTLIDISEYLGENALRDGRLQVKFPLPNGQNWGKNGTHLYLYVGYDLTKVEVVINKEDGQVKKLTFIGYVKDEKGNELKKAESHWLWNGLEMVYQEEVQPAEAAIKSAYSNDQDETRVDMTDYFSITGDKGATAMRRSFPLPNGDTWKKQFGLRIGSYLSRVELVVTKEKGIVKHLAFIGYRKNTQGIEQEYKRSIFIWTGKEMDVQLSDEKQKIVDAYKGTDDQVTVDITDYLGSAALKNGYWRSDFPLPNGKDIGGESQRTLRLGINMSKVELVVHKENGQVKKVVFIGYKTSEDGKEYENARSEFLWDGEKLNGVEEAIDPTLISLKAAYSESNKQIETTIDITDYLGEAALREARVQHSLPLPNGKVWGKADFLKVSQRDLSRVEMIVKKNADGMIEGLYFVGYKKLENGREEEAGRSWWLWTGEAFEYQEDPTYQAITKAYSSPEEQDVIDITNFLGPKGFDHSGVRMRRSFPLPNGKSWDKTSASLKIGSAAGVKAHIFKKDGQVKELIFTGYDVIDGQEVFGRESHWIWTGEKFEYVDFSEQVLEKIAQTYEAIEKDGESTIDITPTLGMWGLKNGSTGTQFPLPNGTSLKRKVLRVGTDLLRVELIIKKDQGQVKELSFVSYKRDLDGTEIKHKTSRWFWQGDELIPKIEQPVVNNTESVVESPITDAESPAKVDKTPLTSRKVSYIYDRDIFDLIKEGYETEIEGNAIKIDISEFLGQSFLKDGKLRTAFPLPNGKTWGDERNSLRLGISLSKVEAIIIKDGKEIKELIFVGYARDESGQEYEKGRSEWTWNGVKFEYQEVNDQTESELREAYSQTNLKDEIKIDLTSYFSKAYLFFGYLPRTFILPNGKSWGAQKKISQAKKTITRLGVGVRLAKLEVIIHKKEGIVKELEFIGYKMHGDEVVENNRARWLWDGENFEYINDKVELQIQKAYEGAQTEGQMIDVTDYLGASSLLEGKTRKSFPLPNGKKWSDQQGLRLGSNLSKVEAAIARNNKGSIEITFIGYRKEDGKDTKLGWSRWVWNNEKFELVDFQKTDKENVFYAENSGAFNALKGNPGDLLDVLLVLYGDKRKPEAIKQLVRRFEELNLKELQISGGKGRESSQDSLLLEFYFQQASLVNQKDSRDRQTLIQVFLKLAFRSLMRPETQIPVMQELLKRRKDGIFFEELYEAVRTLVEDAMVYQPGHIKTKLLPHQAVAAYYLNSHPRAHLGDFTGAGKTIEVLSAIDPGWKVFVAVPANLIDNWVKEIHKHIKPEVLNGMEIVVLRGPPQKRKQLMEATRDKKGVIIIGSIQGLRKKSALEFAGLTNGLDLMVVDESQEGSNYRGFDSNQNSQQAEALQLISSPKKWYLSATGYGSNPQQLFAMLHALYKGTPDEERFSDYKRFVRLYPINTAEGLRYLRGEMLKVSLSREADEVMDRYEDPDTIPFERQGARLPNLEEVPYKKLGGYTLNDEQARLLLLMIHNFQEFASWYNERVPPEKQLSPQNMNPFTKLRFIFQLLIDPKRVGGTTDSPYWDAFDKVIETYMASGKKGIIYTNNVFLLDAIMEKYAQYGVARIDGAMQGYAKDASGNLVKGYFNEDGELVIDAHDPRSVPIESKTYQKHLFQNDPNYRLIIVNSKAGGVGLDLTAAGFMVHAQLPEFFTKERQLDGRSIRADLSRPRFRVDKIQLVAQFSEDFVEKYTGTPYEDLAKKLSESGTPSEIQLERLSTQREVFKYVMTDLATDEDLDIFDPNSISKLIPGFMEDPTMNDYLTSLNTNQLRKTIQIFLPLYERAQTSERKRDVVRIAELFYRAGYLDLSKDVIDLLAQEDDQVIKLLGAMQDIPNKFARKKWLDRVLRMITNDITTNGVEFSDIIANFDFLSEEDLFLALPIYEVSKGFENGATLRYLVQLLAEIQHTYKDQPFKMKSRFQELLQWLVSVDSAFNTIDARDTLKDILEKHGNLFVDSKIPLVKRLAVFEKLVRLVQFSGSREILMQQAEFESIESLDESLLEATVKASQELFGFSEQMARDFVLSYPAVLTALQIKKSLKSDSKYTQEANQLDEVMEHIALGDYNDWRNKQSGERKHGKKIEFLADEALFWENITAEETVELSGIEVDVTQHRDQILKLVGQIQENLQENDSWLIGELDGDWVRNKFRQQVSDGPHLKRLGGVRGQLSQLRGKLKKETSLNALTENDWQLIKSEEGLQGSSPQELAEVIGRRLTEYQRLDDWLQINEWFNRLTTAPTIEQNKPVEITLILSKLIGRSSNQELIGLSDQLDLLLSLLNQINEKAKYSNLTVEFTTNPSLILERGMLQPQLTDCFNCYSDPRQISTLVDDLGSRNKILAIVKDENGRILARSVVKIKQLEDGTPVLFPERPLNARGYDFENEILEALRKSKVPKLTQWRIGLAREGKAKDSRIKIFETGGYSDREYFEPLFGVRKRSTDGDLIYHLGLLVRDQSGLSQVPGDQGELEAVAMQGRNGGALKDLSVFDPARPLPEPKAEVLDQWKSQALQAPTRSVSLLDQDLEVKVLYVDPQSMSGLNGYHFSLDGQLVVVLPSSILNRSYLIDEILFHEGQEWAREKELTSEGAAQDIKTIKRDSHIIAWIDQIMEYTQDNGLTPLQQAMMSLLSDKDRQLLLSETDRSYQDELARQYYPGRYEEYLKNKQKFQEELADPSNRTSLTASVNPQLVETYKKLISLSDEVDEWKFMNLREKWEERSEQWSLSQLIYSPGGIQKADLRDSNGNPVLADIRGNYPHWIYVFENVENGNTIYMGQDDMNTLFPGRDLLENARVMRAQKEEEVKGNAKTVKTIANLQKLFGNTPTSQRLLTELWDVTKREYSNPGDRHFEQIQQVRTEFDELWQRGFLSKISLERFLEIYADLSQAVRSSKRWGKLGYLSPEDQTRVAKIIHDGGNLTPDDARLMTKVHAIILDLKNSLMKESLTWASRKTQAADAWVNPRRPAYHANIWIANWLAKAGLNKPMILDVGANSSVLWSILQTVAPELANDVVDLEYDKEIYERAPNPLKVRGDIADLAAGLEGDETTRQLVLEPHLFDVVTMNFVLDQLNPKQVLGALKSFEHLLASSEKKPLLIITMPKGSPLQGSEFEKVLVQLGYRPMVQAANLSNQLTPDAEKRIREEDGEEYLRTVKATLTEKVFHVGIYQKTRDVSDSEIDGIDQNRLEIRSGKGRRTNGNGGNVFEKRFAPYNVDLNDIFASLKQNDLVTGKVEIVTMEELRHKSEFQSFDQKLKILVWLNKVLTKKPELAEGISRLRSMRRISDIAVSVAQMITDPETAFIQADLVRTVMTGLDKTSLTLEEAAMVSADVGEYFKKMQQDDLAKWEKDNKFVANYDEAKAQYMRNSKAKVYSVQEIHQVYEKIIENLNEILLSFEDTEDRLRPEIYELPLSDLPKSLREMQGVSSERTLKLIDQTAREFIEATGDPDSQANAEDVAAKLGVDVFWLNYLLKSQRWPKHRYVGIKEPQLPATKADKRQLLIKAVESLKARGFELNDLSITNVGYALGLPKEKNGLSQRKRSFLEENETWESVGVMPQDGHKSLVDDYTVDELLTMTRQAVASLRERGIRPTNSKVLDEINRGKSKVTDMLFYRLHLEGFKDESLGIMPNPIRGNTERVFPKLIRAVEYLDSEGKPLTIDNIDAWIKVKYPDLYKEGWLPAQNDVNQRRMKSIGILLADESSQIQKSSTKWSRKDILEGGYFGTAELGPYTDRIYNELKAIIEGLSINGQPVKREDLARELGTDVYWTNTLIFLAPKYYHERFNVAKFTLPTDNDQRRQMLRDAAASLKERGYNRIDQKQIARALGYDSVAFLRKWKQEGLFKDGESWLSLIRSDGQGGGLGSKDDGSSQENSEALKLFGWKEAAQPSGETIMRWKNKATGVLEPDEKIIDGQKYSAKVIYNDEDNSQNGQMPARSYGYHLLDANGNLDAVVIMPGLTEEEQLETFVHEIDDHADGHVVAAAKGVLKFGSEKDLTPMHNRMLREATDEDLQDLLDETDRSSQHAEIREALGEEPLGKVQAYEQMLIVKVKDELAKRKSADQSAPGGIDMNANALDLQSEGKGGRFDIPFDPAKWENLKFDGFTPVILQINTTNLPLFIGAKEVDRTIQLSRI